MVTTPFQEAKQQIPAGNWLDDLARASLDAANAKFTPTRHANSVLTVSLAGREATAWEAGNVAIALQRATAKIGQLLKSPNKEHTQDRAANRDDAPLIQRGSTGGTLYFSFPLPTSVDGDALLAPVDRSLSERAVLELISILPHDRDDDGALDAMLSRGRTEKAAVRDLVNVVTSIENGLTLSISGTQDEHALEGLTSTVTLEQAVTLRDSFKESSIEREQFTISGKIDGMRSSRRIFYLDTPEGRTLRGAVDLAQIDDVKNAIGSDVVATLEATTKRDRAGRQGRTTYRLLSLAVADSLPAATEA